MKPKENRSGDKNSVQGFDSCYTPFYAVDPLLPYLPSGVGVWESACGSGQIVKKLTASGLGGFSRQCC